MAKLKIGDIIEIKTSNGFVYAHYTHKNQKYGHLIRVYDMKYSEAITDFDKLGSLMSRIDVFFH